MYVVYLAVRFFPYWALPVILILGDLTIHFRRKGSSNQWLCGAMAGTFFLLTILWFAFRGDLYSDSWVRTILG